MFWVRLRSSIILVVLAFAALYAGGNVLLAAMFFLSLIAYRELAEATGVGGRRDPAGTEEIQRKEPHKKRKMNALETVGICGIILYYGLLFANRGRWLYIEQTGILFSVVCVFMAGLFVYVFGFPKYEASQVTAAFFSFAYGPVCLSFVYLTGELGRELSSQRAVIGRFIVWLILLSSWGCDTCAYVVGMLCGKHKMSPVLSPKKSVEGAVGGVLGAAALGALYGYAVKDRVLGDGKLVAFFALICGVGALISMVGDLAASAVKRNAGLKDYGNLIPGHGGVMDRFDSVIFTAPVIYFMSVVLLT